LFIRSYIRWKNGIINRDGLNICELPQTTAVKDLPAEAYRQTGISYAKFFKMDTLCRVAFVAGELLDIPRDISNKAKIGTVISTSSGCIDVDKKFEDSRQEIASPALFVYTLPNIMLGELCIRHGFKGAQMCFIEERPYAPGTFFHVSDLISRRSADACLCGHIDASENGIDASLMWVSREQGPVAFTEEQVKKIYEAA